MHVHVLAVIVSDSETIRSEIHRSEICSSVQQAMLLPLSCAKTLVSLALVMHNDDNRPMTWQVSLVPRPSALAPGVPADLQADLSSMPRFWSWGGDWGGSVSVDVSVSKSDHSGSVSVSVRTRPMPSIDLISPSPISLTAAYQK